MAKAERSLFDAVDENAEAQADERAEADIANGRTISHAAMKAWLSSWETAGETQPPKDGD